MLASSDGAPVNVLNVGNFLWERRQNIELLRKFNYSTNEMAATTKRKIDRLRYRTRSYKRYKIRKVAVFGDQKTTKADNTVTTLYRKCLRRKISCPHKLTSHNWHSKRMKMQFDSGCFYSSHSASLGYKAIENAFKVGCVVHDCSMQKILLLIGCNMVDNLKCFTDPHLRLFTESSHKHFERNLGHFEIYFHEKGMFPLGCIGPIEVAFVSSGQLQDRGCQMVSLSMHPSIFQVVKAQVVKEACFTIKEHDCLDRFSLRGPGSVSVLTGLTRNAHREDSALFCNKLLGNRHLNRLWQDGVSLAVDIPDPRLPVKQEQIEAAMATGKWPAHSRVSPLWDTQKLEEHCADFQKDHELLKTQFSTRQKHWDSDNTVRTTISAAKCPLVLIRRRSGGVKGLDGWDILVPKVWSKVIWQAIQFSRAIAIGFSELAHLRKNAGLLSFPKDFPDCDAGRRYWTSLQCRQHLRNDALPHRKKLSRNNLEMLLKSLSGWHGGFSVAKSSSLSEQPRTVAVRGSHSEYFRPPSLAHYLFELNNCEDDAHAHDRVVDSLVPQLQRLPHRTLVHVSLTTTSRGLPMDLAEILWPLEEDYSHWVQHKEETKTKRLLRNDGTNQLQSTMSRDWRGHQLGNNESHLVDGSSIGSSESVPEYEGRRLIGFVSSGQQPHLNRNIVLGVCDALALNGLFRSALGKHNHAQSHYLVLWRNSGSNYLRPGLIEII